MRMMKRMASLSCTLIVVLLFVNLRCSVSSAAAHGEAPDKDEEKKPKRHHRGMNTGGLSRAVFPKGFVFGAATSAYQVEGMALKGGRGTSMWDAYIRVPGRIPNNATANVAADQYHHYKEDIDYMKRMNFDAYRFSISWSRIFPEGKGKVNCEGVAYYNRLINYLLKQGITPYVTIYHEDLPEALGKEYPGFFLSTNFIEVYADYAEFLFKTFGDRVKNWITMNEPRVMSWFGYDLGYIPPGRCTNCTEGNSATEPYIVAHNLILCHAAAVQRYRTTYKDKQKGRIGITLDCKWYEPLTNSADDLAAAQRSRDFHVGWFLHPITYGKYPESMQKIVRERLPRFTKEQIKMVKGSIDFLGINHYTTSYSYDPHLPIPQEPIDYQSDWHVEFTNYRNGTPIGRLDGNLDWLYTVPWGLYKVVTYIKEHYKNPTVVITENGLDDPSNVTLQRGTHDTKRVKFYRSYLSQLKKGIDEGANVAGYFAWALVDTFEWNWGYNSRFGLLFIDFETLRRYPKKSAFWFQKMLRRETNKNKKDHCD